MTFEEAIATPVAGRIQLSSSEPTEGTRSLGIYDLTADGFRLVAHRQVPEAQHGALVLDLAARGFPVAEMEVPGYFIWLRHGADLDVYGLKRREFSAAGDRATLWNGRVIERADILRVIAFADADHEYRGVKATLRSGESIDLVTDVSISAMAGFYIRNDLQCETVWAAVVAQAIAAWAGARYENQI